MSPTNSSVDQVFDVLSLLSERSEPVGVADLARALGVPASTAHRIIITLVEAGYAAHGATGSKYQLGPAAQELTHALLGRFPIARACRPVVGRLAAETGSTALLICRVGWYAVRLAGAEGWREIHAAPRLGQTSLLEDGPGGLAILLGLDEAEQREYLRRRSGKGEKALRARLAAGAEAGEVLERHEDGRFDLAVAVETLPGGVATSLVVEGAGPEGGVRAARKLAGEVKASARILETMLLEDPDLALDPFAHIPPDDLGPGFEPGARSRG